MTPQQINALPLWPLALVMVPFYAFAAAYFVAGMFLPYGCDLGPVDTVMFRVEACR